MEWTAGIISKPSKNSAAKDPRADLLPNMGPAGTRPPLACRRPSSVPRPSASRVATGRIRQESHPYDAGGSFHQNQGTRFREAGDRRRQVHTIV
jgi:hypothetical protein